MERANNMENNNNPTVSIVIVCMNNLKNLYRCLESIKKYTKVDYECFVVAYLFTKENLEKVKLDFPWVKFIESNEIRGFSENNNLALRQARGKYCFVQNDDTEIKEPVIDKLVQDLENLPNNAAIISPKAFYGDGSFQCNGRPAHNTWKYILSMFHLWSEKRYFKEHENRKGIFKSYEIVGAYFLIKRELFEKIGWFDERYFFCPEDVAVSYNLRKLGYDAYVDADVSIIHYEGMTGRNYSLTKTATRPAGTKGAVIFYGKGNVLLQIFLELLTFLITIPTWCYHFLNGKLSPTPNANSVLALGDRNILESILTTQTPKEIFIKYYSKLKH